MFTQDPLCHDSIYPDKASVLDPKDRQSSDLGADSTENR
jgi:hypothetical protein